MQLLQIAILVKYVILTMNDASDGESSYGGSLIPPPVASQITSNAIVNRHHYRHAK